MISQKKIEDLNALLNIKVEFSISKQLFNVLMESYIAKYMPKQSNGGQDPYMALNTLNATPGASPDMMPANQQNAASPSNGAKNIYYLTAADLVKNKTISVDHRWL